MLTPKNIHREKIKEGIQNNVTLDIEFEFLKILRMSNSLLIVARKKIIR